MDLKDIFNKKRINKKEKNYLSRLIIDHSLKLIEKDGEFIEIKNIETKPKGVKKGILNIMLTTPFNKLLNTDYIVDIWCEGRGKVFSVHWSDINNLDIVNFKRGDWITVLFSL